MSAFTIEYKFLSYYPLKYSFYSLNVMFKTLNNVLVTTHLVGGRGAGAVLIYNIEY